MPSSSSSYYISFPVLKTYEIQDIADIRNTVDEMSDAYECLGQQGKFSIRVLLPRGERLISKAKKIGLTIQAEFLLSLKKKRLRVNLKEVRYIHDQHHYGWLLLNPEIYDQQVRIR